MMDSKTVLQEAETVLQEATGLSTGSLEKGQQKEKSAEILAKEAELVLATLSTSIPSMNTHSFSGFGHNLVMVQLSTGSSVFLPETSCRNLWVG